MRSVLVAPIGDHPVIITAAFDALERDSVHIEEVHILCPDESIIRFGADWVKEELPCNFDDVQIYDLPFADANSETTARQYMQMLALILKSCEDAGNEVHLLLTAGRKNMSALTGVIAQFFPCVKKLYNLLDVHENDPLRRNLFTVDELTDWPDEKRREKMHPPADTINLFELPFPRFANATDIRNFLYDPLEGNLPSLTLDLDIEGFYEDIFQQRKSEASLKLWLSKTAFSRFEDIWDNDRRRAEEFRTCFTQMKQPERLHSPNGMHGRFGGREATFHFYKRRRTPERPFYYTLPNPIHTYPNKEVHTVIVCELSVEVEGQYEPDAETLLANADREPYRPYSDLPQSKRSQPTILLIPLGETPMIACQAYSLLKEQINIASVNLIYPDQHPGICKVANQLSRDFNKEGIKCDLNPIPDLRDITSKIDCEIYIKSVAQKIEHLLQQNPETEIHLLLSGGRKSMAALNLFAAQRAGLTKVWHTLVKNLRVEEQLEEEIKHAINANIKRDILFLRRHSLDNFDVFTVPVFPMQ